ncbi:asparagine synthase-related protein [Prosthecochloris sp. SCSIO W1101]|uniref:asparagine synthase-related protein n=1 Tax=Prosthecochloris sp. SCSIO W1101 TaxID=2992242 RepID=UPI00223DA43B|nr:asparagine synthase-related protein [Prosthecochloris sp. SCSIO W1101]UZJ42228.1 asparagine synthase-related protein [Prosthecochloris sp. SCSIO W1101]
MSDFIFSSKKMKDHELTVILDSIYKNDFPNVIEYHGFWGSLAISKSLYNGFQPIEDERCIFCVIGAPVLMFCDNHFLHDNDCEDTFATKLVYDKFFSADGIAWDEDLSGPFVVLYLNKISGELMIVTDLMSFIPVYEIFENKDRVIGTHVDVVAKVGRKKSFNDLVSIADFICSGVVTYPHTMYDSIKQLAPASVFKIFFQESKKKLVVSYWLPKEDYKYDDIDKAANELRENLIEFINSITKNSSFIGLFLSGGEDSRIILSMLPENYIKDAIIFLDYYNKEGRVAYKASEKYGANFKLYKRAKNHYLDYLPHCSELVGSGCQYFHAHTYSFHKSAELLKYSVLLGGFLSDALLKGSHIKKIKVGGMIPFVPQIPIKNYSHQEKDNSLILNKDILVELNVRRNDHFLWVHAIRPKSAEEWFELWPSSMNKNIPNIYANRRLFRMYEPFIHNKVIKLASSVSQNWKLNRRLFQRMAKPLLKPTKHLIHAKGWFPYYPWIVNSFVQPFSILLYTIKKNMSVSQKGFDGPWCDWNDLLSSRTWKEMSLRYAKNESIINILFEDPYDLLMRQKMSVVAKINLMQVLYYLNK